VLHLLAPQARGGLPKRAVLQAVLSALAHSPKAVARKTEVEKIAPTLNPTQSKLPPASRSIFEREAVVA
jgi:hypothetical protein